MAELVALSTAEKETGKRYHTDLILGLSSSLRPRLVQEPPPALC